MISAITTPWSGTLLFAGSVAIGLGYFFGSSGNAAQLVFRYPEAWRAYDIATDALAAAISVTGMSFVRAATARRRTVSFLVVRAHRTRHRHWGRNAVKDWQAYALSAFAVSAGQILRIGQKIEAGKPVTWRDVFVMCTLFPAFGSMAGAATVHLG